MTTRVEAETYYVKPLLPDNNQGRETSYYDLLMEAGQSQTIQLEIVNHTSTNKVFSVDIVDSLTTNSGAIGYDKKGNYDSTLKYKFTDSASALKEVRIKAMESQIIDVTLEMPKEQFDGLMIGGIHISEMKETKETGGIDNVFSYIVPVKIHETEKDFPNQLTFSDIKIKKNNQIAVKIQNPNPNILSDITLQATIYKKGYQGAVYEHTMKNIQIAPNSNFFPLIILEEEQLDAGKYEIEFYAANEKFQEKWKSEFTISKNQVANSNDGFVINKKTLSWKSYGVLGTSFILIAFILIILMMQKKRYPKTNKKKK